MRMIGPLVVTRRRYLEIMLEPWYHDFSPLGLTTPQRGGVYPKNQRSKQPILFEMIHQAVSTARERDDGQVDVIDLFCADGFYSHHALQEGADHVRGLDLDRTEIVKARIVADGLGHRRRADFEVRDVHELDGSYAVGICAGGLYHVADPQAILELLRRSVRHALAVQTVFHLGETDPDYFVTPAPGWTWGCRFSLAHLQRMAAEAGWTIIEQQQNELAGNPDPQNRGSAYLLLEPSPDRP